MNETYDVHGKLEDPMGVLGVALAQWETRGDTRPQPEVRQAANTAVGAIDTMLRELYLMRGRLVSEVRASDDAAMERSARLLEGARKLTEDGRADGEQPEAVVVARCKGCGRGTGSVPCGRCGGPACANCRRCPTCDGDITEDSHG